jgi:hypothetical protein
MRALIGAGLRVRLPLLAMRIIPNVDRLSAPPPAALS